MEQGLMSTDMRPEPTAIVIFGAAGDLTWRKLVPALYNLFVDKWLPHQFAIVGVDRKATSDAEFRQHLREGVDTFSRRGQAGDAMWDDFATRLTFITGDFSDQATFA